MKIKTISYIIPCYNEAEVLQQFYNRAAAVTRELSTYNFEFIFINDGSSDDTPKILNQLADSDRRVKVLHFARNHGHQAAITAGMDFSSGDLLVTIDADLQDPPELIKEILDKAHEGYEVIHAQRRSRTGETKFKLLTAWSFYKILRKLANNNLIENSGDFRAFTRPVLKAVQGFREKHRYMRGIFASIGFKQCVIQYNRDARYAGKTKYSLGKMIKLAINAIFSFSTGPIRFISWLSIVLWLVSLAYLAKALVEHFVFKTTIHGWTSIIILMTFFTGIIIFCLGIIASYVGRIFEQGQNRPIYWLYDTRNIKLSNFEKTLREVRLSDEILEG